MLVTTGGGGLSLRTGLNFLVEPEKEWTPTDIVKLCVGPGYDIVATSSTGLQQVRASDTCLDAFCGTESAAHID